MPISFAKSYSQNEAAIREAAEAAWWEDLQERASAKLVDITADQLRRQMNRGGVQANVVLAIDAVGPKTAAASVVSADGQMIKGEDIACGLGKSQRACGGRQDRRIDSRSSCRLDCDQQRSGTTRDDGRTFRIGGPESRRFRSLDIGRTQWRRRLCRQRYREFAEMRSTPRRFRSAAWLAFSVLHPAQALAKVDPLKLRLNAFQKELSESALASAMEDIMVSGASRGGVDVNGTPAAWLSRLPGMNSRSSQGDRQDASHSELFPSRQALLESGLFDESAAVRQALPFLRVFGSDQSLDGTLVHPDDYALAERLAKSLEIELPPEQSARVCRTGLHGRGETRGRRRSQASRNDPRITQGRGVFRGR